MLMPQYPDIFYHSPIADTAQTADTTGIALYFSFDSVVPSFITQGFGRVVTPLPRVTYDVLQGWDLVIIALVLLLVVLNKQLFPRQFRQALSVPGGVAHTNQLLREWSPLRSFLGVSMLLAYVLVVSLLVQKSVVVITRDVQQFNSFGDLMAIAACVGGWVLARLLALHYLNWLFESKEAIDRQMAVQLSVSILALLFVLPLLVLLLYNPYSMFVWVGVGLLVVAALARFVYGVVETRAAIKIPALFIFLYLCALEIAPIVLLLTAGMRYISHGSVF